jgi:hypothetical protein
MIKTGTISTIKERFGFATVPVFIIQLRIHFLIVAYKIGLPL